MRLTLDYKMDAVQVLSYVNKGDNRVFVKG